MYANQDIIRIEALAVVLDRSRESILRDLNAGRIPPRDINPDGKMSGWKLATLKAWNPRVGRRLDKLLIALQ
ncbi:MAG: hypothetical protein KDI73_11670 [Candidatus Competibacteraceae bacterium]|nr:hypothetical protein [Candidatus Competibacteraceae bacterium]